jgi:hypothetical protein
MGIEKSRIECEEVYNATRELVEKSKKVVLAPCDDDGVLRKAIKEALYFELLYLKFKSNYYTDMAKEDVGRMKRLQNEIDTLG